MARGNPKWKGYNRQSGANIGGKRIHCYVCRSCGGSHKGKPEFACNLPINGGRCQCTSFEHFDSWAELKYYGELTLLEAAGKIRNIERQVPYPLNVTRPDGMAVTIGKYLLDYRIFDIDKNKTRLIEVKGDAVTDFAVWKVAHCEHQYGVTVEIVKR